MKKDSYENIFWMILSSFLWTFTLFILLYNTKSLPGTDAYFHIQLADIMRQNSIILDKFPWATCSIWTDSFFDKDWLFHLFLIPFISAGKFMGAKIALLVCALLISLAWGLLAKEFGIKRHILFLLMGFILFCTGYYFMARLVFCRGHLLSLVFLPLALLCAIHKKRFLLAAIAYLYSLAHASSWQLLPVILLFEIFKPESSEKLLWFTRRGGNHRKWLKHSLVPWVFVGLFAGMFINPYFPANIKGAFIQNIMVLKSVWFGLKEGNIIHGTEFSHLSFRSILTGYLPLLLILGLTFYNLFKYKTFNKLDWKVRIFFILSCIYLAMTIMSQRFTEYLVPVSSIFIFSYWKQFNLLDSWFTPPPRFTLASLARLGVAWVGRVAFGGRRLGASHHEWFIRRGGNHHEWTWKKYMAICIFAIFAIASVYILKTIIYREHIPYEGAGKWLRENVKSGEIIFTGDWDDSPVLFYHAPDLRYVVFLEPYFMYAHSPSKYRLWKKVVEGRAMDTSDIIYNEFQARTVFVPGDRPLLKQKLLRDPRAVLKYKGTDSEYIFSLEFSEEDLREFQELESFMKSGSL